MFLLLFLVAVATCNVPVPPRHLQSAPNLKSQLPEFVAPTSYKLEFRIEEDFYESRQFLATATIKFQITTPTPVDSFQFHAHELKFTETKLTLNTNEISASLSDPDPETDLVTVRPANALENGSYTLAITYTGTIRDDMVGLYISSYVDDFKQTKYMIATQFEEIHARKAFPCFDEPNKKAKFDIYVTKPKNLHVWSNNDQLGSSYVDATNPKLEKVHFSTTPHPMSTYLVALVLAEFNCKNADLVGKTKIQVCSKIGASDNSAKLILDTIPQIVTSMQDYVNYSYSKISPKVLTLAGIPDFAAGAMENWGLITFRNVYLLWDENESSESNKQKVVTVVTHEVAHQWFGDLVTLDWWSELYLNEGFATYFEYHISDIVEENWELTKQFALEQVQKALSDDSSNISLPLSYDVDDADFQKRQGVDVSYSKGGSILRMIHHFLEVDNFKAGLEDYLNANEYGSVTSVKLFDALQSHVDEIQNGVKPPEKLEIVLDSWIKKPNYPLLTVKLVDSSVLISQEQFVVGEAQSSDTKWYVPITYATSKQANFTRTSTMEWLTPESDLELTNVASDWIILNNQQTGFYRVNYDDNLLAGISKVLNNKISVIDELSRAQLIDDQFALAKTQRKTFVDFIKFTSFLKNDDSYYTWTAAFNAFSFLMKRSNKTTRDYLKTYIFQQMEMLNKTIQEEPSSHIGIFRKTLAKSWLCKLGDDSCVLDSRQKFVDYLTNGTMVNPNEKLYVYCNGLRNSTDGGHDFTLLWQLYQKAKLDSEKLTILQSLGCVNDISSRKYYLTLALTETARIKTQDAYLVFSSVLNNNVEGDREIIDFIADNYKVINNRFGGVSTLQSLIRDVSDVITTEDMKEKLSKIAEIEDLDPVIKETISNSLITIENNLLTITKVEGDLNEYFKSTNDGSSQHFANLWFLIMAYICIKFINMCM